MAQDETRPSRRCRPRTGPAWRSSGRGWRLDRTTLAWIRTTLTMATFGFGMVGFFRSLREKSPTPQAVHLHEAAMQFGISLVVLGTVSTVLAGVSHWFTLAQAPARRPPGSDPVAPQHHGGHAAVRRRSGGAVGHCLSVNVRGRR